MIPLKKQKEVKLGISLSTLRQEHADMDAAIKALASVPDTDPMLVQRLKKKKLALKDKIAELERLLLPDIIA